MTIRDVFCITPLVIGCWGLPLAASETMTLNGHQFTLADGMTIEQVAGPPLVDRPVCADFDERGRLYVVDSSGSNAPLEEQLQNPTHRIIQLVDHDGDGQFDERRVFADKFMFPEGAQWHDGSLYVAAPPSIWKLTDTNDDGIADLREEWFQAGTLTHCGNDLHGPYLGPDGDLYWCKGAWAEQTYERPGQAPWITRAAHVFHCRPDAARDPDTGSVLTREIEALMTGGMDNPVEVAFTPGGEAIFTTTFLVHPGGGLRDGLIHAVYGGLYGKPNPEALAGHPRTGPLMPVLQHLGAAAPCGLTRYESDVLGQAYQDNLFACLFNMHKVTRHQLVREGAGFRVQTSQNATGDDASLLQQAVSGPDPVDDFLVSDQMDFHPTDVLEDADGSLLVIDTGGWYKLCCPTSQLEKNDVLGAIYRVRRLDAPEIDDPRGLKLKWESVAVPELIQRLNDARPTIRKRAIETLARHSDRSAAIRGLEAALGQPAAATRIRLNAVWVLIRMRDPEASQTLCRALNDSDQTVREAALHGVSLLQVPQAFDDLLRLLKTGTLVDRRGAATALGRLGNSDAVAPLLQAASLGRDRISVHALTYALIEIGSADVRQGLQSRDSDQIRTALMALDQIPGASLQAEEVIPYLPPPEAWTIAQSTSEAESLLQQTAFEIVDRHPEWAGALTETLLAVVTECPENAVATASLFRATASRLSNFLDNDRVATALQSTLQSDSASAAQQILVIQALQFAPRQTVSDAWQAALAAILQTALTNHYEPVLDECLNLLQSRDFENTPVNAGLREALQPVIDDESQPPLRRLQALAVTSSRGERLSESQVELLLTSIPLEQLAATRALAAEILKQSELDRADYLSLADRLDDVSPIELPVLMECFDRTHDDVVGEKLLNTLRGAAARSALPPDLVRSVFSNYTQRVQAGVDEFLKQLAEESRASSRRLEELLAKLPEGDLRRGQQVFQSTQASCMACHSIGYLGGRIGPDLSAIGRIRTRRDLLESIVFPSASLVRSYEPVAIVTATGRIHTGMIQSETSRDVTLVTGPDAVVRIPVEEIEVRQAGTVSVMPAGLDQQMTLQQLADLLAFLESRK